MKEKEYILHLENCFKNAENNVSKIDSFIENMEGMTGIKTRHFYNNLLFIDDARYLEIGTWKGSSVCAAMLNNEANVLCIDNWSEFGNVKDDFLYNFEKCKGKNRAKFLEADCFSIDLNSIGKFNIYLYDGRHFDIDQQMALTYYINVLDDIFIYIVDDWNWEDVRKSTLFAINQLELKIIWNREIITGPNDKDKNNWWNGIGVFLLKK